MLGAAASLGRRNVCVCVCVYVCKIYIKRGKMKENGSEVKIKEKELGEREKALECEREAYISC